VKASNADNRTLTSWLIDLAFKAAESQLGISPTEFKQEWENKQQVIKGR
jgi:hypothetical protein